MGIQYVLDWYIYDEDEEVIGGMELFLDKELYSRIRNGDTKMDDILNEEYPIQGKYILKYWANEESSLRKDNLSFTHHREVASLPPEWLDTFYGQGKTTSGNQYTGKVRKRNLTDMPVTKKESHLLQWLSKTDSK